MRENAPPVELHTHNWLWYLLHDPLRLGILLGAIVATWLIVRRLRRRTRRGHAPGRRRWRPSCRGAAST